MFPTVPYDESLLVSRGPYTVSCPVQQSSVLGVRPNPQSASRHRHSQSRHVHTLQSVPVADVSVSGTEQVPDELPHA